MQSHLVASAHLPSTKPCFVPFGLGVRPYLPFKLDGLKKNTLFQTLYPPRSFIGFSPVQSWNCCFTGWCWSCHSNHSLTWNQIGHSDVNGIFSRISTGRAKRKPIWFGTRNKFPFGLIALRKLHASSLFATWIACIYPSRRRSNIRERLQRFFSTSIMSPPRAPFPTIDWCIRVSR